MKKTKYPEIAACADKVYGYAINNTFSREEADELAQEILLAAMEGLPRLKDKKYFEGWLWGVAGNVTKVFRRGKGKQRAMYSFDQLEEVAVYDDSALENGEHYRFVRQKVAMLSQIYRDIIILYYYDGLPVKEIALRLGIPEGTVTWRLSAGRSKLKKECATMETAALRPIKMHLGITGSGNYNGTTMPWPSDFINDALSQNIFWHCYEAPKTVGELANLCGVPAYYVEDRLAALLARDALKEPAKGKFQTDFIIYTNKVGEYCREAEKLLLPLENRLLQALETLASQAGRLEIYKAGKPDSELWYLYAAMAFHALSEEHNPVKFNRRPPKYDGNRFSYNAFMENSGGGYGTRMGVQHSGNQGGEGRYSHTVYHFGGFSFRKMMYDNYISVCEKVLNGEEIGDKESAAKAIEAGYILQNSGGLNVAVPAFKKEQKLLFNQMAADCFSPVLADYRAVVSRFAKGYIKLFPAHLEEEGARACGGMFLGLLSALVRFAQESGKIEKPAEGSVCDVLIEFI